MERWLRIVVDRAGWVLAGVALLTLLAASQVVDFETLEPRIQFDPSASGLLPDDDPNRDFYERVRRLFGSDETLLVALVDDDIFTAENLERVKRLTKRFERIKGVHHVLSLSNALNIRASDGDLAIEPFAEGPFDEPGSLERVRQEVHDNPIYIGSLVSRDDRATAILIYLKEMSEIEFLDRGIDIELARIAEEERGAATVLLTGAAHIKAEMSRTLLSDILRTLPLASGVLLIVAVLSFRTIVGMLVPLTTVGIALVWTLGVIAVYTGSLNVITVVVPPLILVVGFAYAVHVVSEFYDMLNEQRESGFVRKTAVANALRHVALPLVLTAATTAAGFISLGTSRLESIREFGVFCTLGVVLTGIVSLTFTPAILNVLPLPRKLPARGADGSFERAAEWLAKFTIRYRVAILLSGALMAVLSIYGTTRIQVSTDVIRLFAPDKPVRMQFEEVNERFGGSDVIYIVLEADYRDAFKDPDNLREVESLQRWLESQPEIGGTTSVVDYLVLINRGFHDGDPEELKIPDSKRLISQLFFFGGNDELDSFVDSRYQTVNIVARSSAIDSGEVRELVRRIEDHVATLPDRLHPTVTGNTVLLNATSDEIVLGQAYSLGTAFLIIFIMLALLFTSLRVGLLALIPNVLPVLAYFGALGFTGITLNTTTGLVACLVVGIAVDDTIHFLARFNTAAKRHADEESGVAEALRTVGRPVTYTSAALCAGFLTISTSELRNQVEFGALAAFVMFVAWLIDMVFTPALAARMRIVTLWDVLALDLGDNPTKSIPLFKGLSNSQARVVALMASVRSLPKGAMLFRRGESGDDAYVVIDGALQASIITDDGDTRPLARMTRGNVVGEVALFHGQRTADVEVVADARLMRFTLDDLNRLRRRYPRTGAQVYANLSTVLADRVANLTAAVR